MAISLLKRLFRRSDPTSLRIGAVVTGYFPIGFLTFVYQELTGMRTLLGADLKILYWHDGDATKLHAAYQPLLSCRVKLEFDDRQHLADRQHFRETKPTRYASLLDRLARETGRSVEEVENDSHFTHACTFAREIERQGVDYVHSYFFYEQSFNALVAAWLLQLPRGVSAYADHMIDDYHFKLVRLHIELADVVVATSQRIKHELVGLSDERFADKIIVKPNGADGQRFEFSERADVSDRLELLSICRIERKKGLLELARAARLLKDAGNSVRIHMVGTEDVGCVGSEEYAREFRALVEQLDVGDMFVTHGFMKHEEMQPLLRDCHAFIAPYVETERGDKDGIPTAVLEAMASGMPILCTDAGSMTEVVRDGEDGFVCAQRDPGALVAIIDRLRTSPELARELGRSARERFASEFDYHVTEPRLHARIRQAIGSAART